MKLVIQTSSGQALLCLLAENSLVARQPDLGKEGPRIQERDLASLTRDLLATAGVTMADISGLAVDVGPGRLAATRMAVAFVNALSFARNLPLQALPAFDLLAQEAARRGATNALILRKASGKRFYYAKTSHGDCVSQGMCRSDALPDLLNRLDSGAALISDFDLPAQGFEAWTGDTATGQHLWLKHAEPETLIPLLATWPDWQPGATPFPVPLTEQAFSQSLE